MFPLAYSILILALSSSLVFYWSKIVVLHCFVTAKFTNPLTKYFSCCVFKIKLKHVCYNRVPSNMTKLAFNRWLWWFRNHCGYTHRQHSCQGRHLKTLKSGTLKFQRVYAYGLWFRLYTGTLTFGDTMQMSLNLRDLRKASQKLAKSLRLMSRLEWGLGCAWAETLRWFSWKLCSL